MKNIEKLPDFLKVLIVGKIYELQVNNWWTFPYANSEEFILTRRLHPYGTTRKVKAIFLGHGKEPYNNLYFVVNLFWTKWFAEGNCFWTAMDPKAYNSKIILIEK